MPPNDKSIYAMLDYFILLYTEKYGFKPRVNKYRDKWGMKDVLEDVGKDKVVELLDYYFSLERDHSLVNFYSNYDRLDEAKSERDKDRETRRALMEKTKRRMQGDNTD